MAETIDPLKKPRRFYKTVAVAEAPDGIAVTLDGRTPRSPKGKTLTAPTRALGELIAAEWEGQGEQIDMGSMRATRLAHTALDIVPNARAATIEGVTRYAGADLVCYFAEGPTSLIERQSHIWGSLLNWVDEVHGLRFTRAVGIVHRDQPPETLAKLAARLEPLDDFTLAGLAYAAALFGSAVIALALRDKRVNAENAMAAARLDEIFQESRWGVDAEAAAKADAMAVDAVMAERWFAALGA